MGSSEMAAENCRESAPVSQASTRLNYATCMQAISVALGIVLRSDKVLLCQRRYDNPVLPGVWEFPGGKVEAGETIEDCLHRELLEEVNIRVEVVGRLPAVEHFYPDRRVQLHPLICVHRHGEPESLQSEQCRWVALDMLKDFNFPPANEVVLEALGKWLRERTESVDAARLILPA